MAINRRPNDERISEVISLFKKVHQKTYKVAFLLQVFGLHGHRFLPLFECSRPSEVAIKNRARLYGKTVDEKTLVEARKFLKHGR